MTSLNMVYADTSGTIGWQLVGEAPQRLKGWGTLPLHGPDADVGWHEDHVPFDEMPHLSDPDTGFLATANNQPTSEGHGPFLGVDWIDGYRLARIVEALGSRDDWDIKSVQALQMDEKSVPWQELRQTVLASPVNTEDGRRGLDLLESWDGVVSAESAAATLFEFFISEMANRVARSKAPRSVAWVVGKGFNPVVPYTIFSVRRIGHLSRLLQEQPQGWFERPWPDETADALASAVGQLKERFGEDRTRWTWGRVRPLTLKHPLAEISLFRPVFNLGPFPWGGDANTVSQAAFGP